MRTSRCRLLFDGTDDAVIPSHRSEAISDLTGGDLTFDSAARIIESGCCGRRRQRRSRSGDEAGATGFRRSDHFCRSSIGRKDRFDSGWRGSARVAYGSI